MSSRRASLALGRWPSASKAGSEHRYRDSIPGAISCNPVRTEAQAWGASSPDLRLEAIQEPTRRQAPPIGTPDPGSSPTASGGPPPQKPSPEFPGPPYLLPPQFTATPGLPQALFGGQLSRSFTGLDTDYYYGDPTSGDVPTPADTHISSAGDHTPRQKA